METLWKKISAEDPELDYRKTFLVIKLLVDQQYLLPGVFPSLLTQSPFDDVCQQISEADQLESVDEVLSVYNRLPVGEGEKALVGLQSYMDGLAKAKTAVQVDLAIEGKNIILSKEVVLEVEKALSSLVVIHNSSPTFIFESI